MCVRNAQLVQINLDEAGREKREIEDEPYYHGYVNPEEVNSILLKEGHFLIRKSEYRGKPIFVLSVRKNKVSHIAINRTSTKRLYWVFNFAFKTVPDLVQYHCRNHETVNEEPIYLGRPVFKAKWQLNHEQVHIEKRLGGGNFGEVAMGFLQNSPFEEAIKVAIKTLPSAEFNMEEKMKFINEAGLMLPLKHRNVVQMHGIAACRDPIMVVMELCDGSLIDRLAEHKHAQGEGPRKMDELERQHYVYGAAKGMDYLHHMNIIHRDIAARNILISHGEAKITDFGLSCIGQHKMRKLKDVPVRTLAPETLKQGRYSLKSDVWSFGIFIYEMYSFGGEPYPEIEANAEIKNIVLSGVYSLNALEEMPPKMKEMYRLCLTFYSLQRPSFGELVHYMEANLDGIRIYKPPITEALWSMAQWTLFRFFDVITGNIFRPWPPSIADNREDEPARHNAFPQPRPQRELIFQDESEDEKKDGDKYKEKNEKTEEKGGEAPLKETNIKTAEESQKPEESGPAVPLPQDKTNKDKSIIPCTAEGSKEKKKEKSLDDSIKTEAEEPKTAALPAHEEKRD